MKTIFDPAIREELSSRINSLTPQHQAQWGKMNDKVRSMPRELSMTSLDQ